jgi:hypothetical protein
MKVQFVGKLNIDAVAKKLVEIADSTIERIEKEQEGVNITGFEVHDAEFTVKLNVEGMDEPQVLTVEHHKGAPEMFKWIVNPETDEANSNEDESEFDAYTVAKAQGKEMEFKEIGSIYGILDLEEITELSEVYGNMSKKVYEHKDGFRVVQVRQNRKLIQEYKLIPKEDKKEELVH